MDFHYHLLALGFLGNWARKLTNATSSVEICMRRNRHMHSKLKLGPDTKAETAIQRMAHFSHCHSLPSLGRTIDLASSALVAVEGSFGGSSTTHRIVSYLTTSHFTKTSTAGHIANLMRPKVKEPPHKSKIQLRSNRKNESFGPGIELILVYKPSSDAYISSDV